MATDARIQPAPREINQDAMNALLGRAVQDMGAALQAPLILIGDKLGFYRAMARIEMEEDRVGTIADLAFVVARFQMPGDGLIPNYQERLRESGAGISSRQFVEHALFPTLKVLGATRAELKAAPLPVPVPLSVDLLTTAAK